jgi:nitrate/nitrite transporter NarK
LVVTFSFMQTGMTTFLVPMLTEKLSFDVRTAGSLFMLVMIAGGIGRVFWGWFADRVCDPTHTVVLIGGAMAVDAVALTQIPPGTDWTIVAALGIAFGGTAMGWHGVVLAQVSRLVGRERTGHVTGGIMFLALGSSFVAPNLFSALTLVSRGYSLGFAVFSGLVLLSCAALRRKVAGMRIA